MTGPVYALWLDCDTSGRAAEYALHAQEHFGAVVWVITPTTDRWAWAWVDLYARRLSVARILPQAFAADAHEALSAAMRTDRPSRLVFVADGADVAIDELRKLVPGLAILACDTDESGVPTADTEATWREVGAFLAAK